LDIYRTAIPMRRFEHAAAAREVAEAVLVRLEGSDGQTGWGETLPRPYVTGETIDSVVADLSGTIWPAVAGEALDGPEFLPSIPRRSPDGRCLNAAACALDLASLTWTLAGLRRSARVVPTGRTLLARVSGVLGSSDPGRAARTLRLMRWFGLRDFKLKLGLGEQADQENLRRVCQALGPEIAKGKSTLRVDVNGAWNKEEVPGRARELAALGVCVLEQPIFCPAAELADLARKCDLPLMADESLLTPDDAKALLAEPKRVWWNIRLSKNGGLAGALELARLAGGGGVTFAVGCMVGESSILSAAQRRLLQLAPPPRFVEGNYGRFLLAGDLTKRSLRLGYGGRLGPLAGAGLGMEVDHRRLMTYGRLLASLRA
jgi:muconate cycloisomerase